MYMYMCINIYLASPVFSVMYSTLLSQHVLQVLTLRVGTPHASHALLTARQPRLDCLSVHVFQATIELLMKDLVWPALVSDTVSDLLIVRYMHTYITQYTMFMCVQAELEQGMLHFCMYMYMQLYVHVGLLSNLCISCKVYLSRSFMYMYICTCTSTWMPSTSTCTWRCLMFRMEYCLFWCSSSHNPLSQLYNWKYSSPITFTQLFPYSSSCTWSQCSITLHTNIEPTY